MSEDITQTIAEDDWAAAMAEQATPAAVQSSPEIFPELSATPPRADWPRISISSWTSRSC